MNTLKRTKDGGLFWQVGLLAAHVQILRIHEESGAVHLVVELSATAISQQHSDLVVHLTAGEAMAFANAFRRTAIAALEHESDLGVIHEKA
jgi:hypothetical protein